ncbi:MAG TPA: peptidyl-prolyl cis-trans isomerase [Candidatus Spyradenecus faecavium]|uniref:peptidylprolyl isomerase n=1 Tax=Candidatus Spyradenecus faecavium TaxID=2840947 RepID=A0A9D1NN65_9BACT|nr:peptidyl-prolyl cis-trans isomerase [Candidatus Spyradenecus faecavium]
MKRPLLTLSLTLTLCAAVLRAEPSFYDGVAAYVNDKVVTVDAVMQELHNSFDLRQVPPAEQAGRIRALFPVVRDMLVNRTLILEAYEASGAELPNEAVNARVQEIIADQFGGDEAKLKETLRESRLTRDEWVKKVRENMIVMAMQQLQVDRKIVVSPKKIREYYAAHAADFAEGAGTHVRSITINPEGGAKAAEAALAELKAGKPFAEVAKAHSADPQAAQGGDWGFVDPAANFAAPIVEALAKLKPGETSGVVEMGDWRAIVQKVDERAGEPPSLAEAWPRVEAAVRAELGQVRYNEWVEGLRKNAYIKNVDVKLQ